MLKKALVPVYCYAAVLAYITLTAVTWKTRKEHKNTFALDCSLHCICRYDLFNSRLNVRFLSEVKENSSHQTVCMDFFNRINLLEAF